MLAATTLLWLTQLEEETRRVEALSCVKSVAFHTSDISANRNKVVVNVWCCWEPSRRTFKQIVEACDEKGLSSQPIWKLFRLCMQRSQTLMAA